MDPRRLEKARAIFTSLAKYINAKTIYTANNPNVANFARGFYESFRAFFEDEKELVLAVEQYQIKWRDEIVYANLKKAESIAFILFKDGVGELSVGAPVKPDELERFVDIIRDEIYNPSSHLDIVGRLWQAEFVNISYRVFDECADKPSGQGAGSSSDPKQEPTRASDHRGLPSESGGHLGGAARADSSIEPLHAYFNGIVERRHPGASPREKEKRLQDILESFYTVRGEELEPWREEFYAVNEGNKLLQFLELMLDFTERRTSPSAARDVLDIIERLVHYIAEEADIPTLIALLEIQKRMSGGQAPAVDFQTLPDRIKDELTNTPFLLSLGKVAGRSPEVVRGRLRYFQMIGKDAVPGVCELLEHLEDPALHPEACESLLAIAGDDILRVIDELDLESPREAKDAVYLVRRSGMREIPPVARKLMASADAQVRVEVIQYLAQLGTDEAAELLCGLLQDRDESVRMQAFAAVEDVRHPLIVDKVAALCFAGDPGARSADELERMFRAVGKLSGERALAPINQMIKGNSWLPAAKIHGRQNKLLAVTALRYIPGEQSLKMLNKLAADRDKLVKTKAQYALKQLEIAKGVPGCASAAAEGKAAKE